MIVQLVGRLLGKRMTRRRRKHGWRLLVTVALVLPMYGLLVLHSPAAQAEFPLDLAAVRALAESLPGDKPLAVRYEQVGAFVFYEAMLVAGDPWRKTPLPIVAYQLVFPEQTILIDTGLERATASHTLMLPQFNDAASAKVRAAMDAAAQIVITHEHEDHIGSITTAPNLAALKPKLRLTAEQFANRAGMKPAVLPLAPLADYTPLHYDARYALAPGVVLIKSPGHSPGSQMVYVRLADGRELLFIGDISTRLRNIELERERPWFMTVVIGEDRKAVLAELKTLHQLMQTNPEIAIIPSHDGAVLKMRTDAGLLVAGFLPPPAPLTGPPAADDLAPDQR